MAGNIRNANIRVNDGYSPCGFAARPASRHDAGHEYRQAAQNPDPQQRQKQLATYAATCQIDYGIRAGTPQFSQCMMMLDQQDRQRRATMGAALLAKSQSCTFTPGFGGTMMSHCF